MNIGIIGGGHIGGTLAVLWAKSGHDILVSSRHPDMLDPLLKQIGPRCCKGTFSEAARFGEIVLLAIPLGGIIAISSDLEKSFSGKIVLDAMNPFAERDGEIAVDIIHRKIASGQATQERFPSAKIVRAFSSVRFLDLQSQSNRTPPAVAVPYSTDFDDAKNFCEKLIRDAGFAPFDLGPLNHSKPLDPGGVLFGKALTEHQILELLHY
jgi:8-hydroxy-5-deazaflavin:NADPH oxidoreductase